MPSADIAVLLHYLQRYGPFKGTISGSRKGVMVSMSDGRATMYALYDLLARGTFFIAPGDEVYAGMVIGEHTRYVVCYTLVVIMHRSRVCLSVTGMVPG